MPLIGVAIASRPGLARTKAKFQIAIAAIARNGVIAGVNCAVGPKIVIII
jgi:hypothetical protein